MELQESMLILMPMPDCKQNIFIRNTSNISNRIQNKTNNMIIQEAHIESTNEPIYSVVDTCMTCNGLCEVILFVTKNRNEAEEYMMNAQYN